MQKDRSGTAILQKIVFLYMLKYRPNLLLCAICAFLCGAPTALTAASKPGSAIIELLKDYDSQKGKARIVAADRIFTLLAQEDITEGRLVASSRMKADSLDMLVWYWAGEYLWTTQDYDEGLEYSLKALPLTGRWGDPLMESDCEHLVGLFYFRRADYEKAVGHLSRSLELCREEGEESRVGSTLNSLAGVCLTAKQLDESEKYILEAIRICEKANDTNLLPIRYGMASEVYHIRGENLKSLDYAIRAFRLDSLQGNTARMGIRLSQMASAQMALGQEDAAVQSLERAIPILEEAGNLGSLSICHNQMGELLSKRGHKKDAAAHFEIAAGVFAERGDMYGESRAQRGLYEALRESDPGRADKHLLRYSTLKDSIYHRDMQQAVSEFNVKFRTEELIRQEEKARMRNRALALGIVALTFLVLFIGAVWFYTSRLQQRKLKELERYIAMRDQYARAAKERKEVEKEAIVEADDADLQFLLKVSDTVNSLMDEGKKTDIASIAACVCMSDSRFYRRIVALTGHNPSSYIQRLKIQRAKNLLDTNPQMNLYEVAERCGFEAYPNFVRAFKNVTQLTPSEYRKQQKK